MKSKKNIVTTVLIMIIFLSLSVFVILSLPNNKKEYDFTNKIFSSFPNDNDDANGTLVIFNKNGEYYNFTNIHDEGCILRSTSGSWKRNENGNIYVKYDKAIYYDGGELVETEESDYFNIRRINYKLVKKNYPFDTTLKFIINKGLPDEIYKDYLTINEARYYPIYKFETEEELYKKLEEIYGELYTMLIDDSIEALDDIIENNNTDKEE